MANKVFRWSTPFTIKEIKSILRFHLTPVKCKWQQRLGRWKSGRWIRYWWECWLVQPLWKSEWRFFRKVTIELPCNSAVPLQSICWKDSVSYHSPLHIHVYFCKRLKCLPADEGKTKTWYIRAVQFYSAIKKKMKFTGNCLKLENIKWPKSSKTKHRYFSRL